MGGAVLCGCVQNIMTFNKCSISGTAYGDVFDERGEPVDVTEVQSRSSHDRTFSLLCQS